MGLINEAKEFYKDSYLLLIMNIFYNYIHYFLSIIYLCWHIIHIIYLIVNKKNSLLKEFANENYINYYLIFYSFYKIHSFVKKRQNLSLDIIFSALFLAFIGLDFINKNTIHPIQYWILYNLEFSIFIFIYGTLYMIIKSDFDTYKNVNVDDRLELIADIISETV